MPASICVEEILNRVADINISHKPNLKNIKSPCSTVGQLHEDSAYGLQKFLSEDGLDAVFKFGKKEMEKDVTEYIPMFYDKADKKEYYDAYKEWFILDKKSSIMMAEGKEQKQYKREVAEKEKKAIARLRTASQKHSNGLSVVATFVRKYIRYIPRIEFVVFQPTIAVNGKWKLCPIIMRQLDKVAERI